MNKLLQYAINIILLGDDQNKEWILVKIFDSWENVANSSTEHVSETGHLQ